MNGPSEGVPSARQAGIEAEGDEGGEGKGGGILKADRKSATLGQVGRVE